MDVFWGMFFWHGFFSPSRVSQQSQQPSYDSYVACIPSTNHYKLRERVDPGTSVELHLYEIASVLVKWKQLIPLLSLTDVDESDITHVLDPQEKRYVIRSKGM